MELNNFEYLKNKLMNKKKKNNKFVKINRKRIEEINRKRIEEINRKRIIEINRKRIEEINRKRIIEINRKRTEENRKRTEENRKRTEENRKRTEENRKRTEENRKRIIEINRKRTEEINRKRTEENRKRIEEIKFNKLFINKNIKIILIKTEFVNNIDIYNIFYKFKKKYNDLFKFEINDITFDNELKEIELPIIKIVKNNKKSKIIKNIDSYNEFKNIVYNYGIK
jgi:hypothetical protein